MVTGTIRCNLHMTKGQLGLKKYVRCNEALLQRGSFPHTVEAVLATTLVKRPALIGHFRVPKTLTFKMRPSAQPFL